MKKINVLLFVLFLSYTSSSLLAQTKDDIEYFIGKWSVLVKGTPNGDGKMIFVLEKSGDELIGVVQDEAGVETGKIDKVDVAANAITVYFSAQGFDVDVLLNKKDQDHLTGSLMGMFTAEGERLKK